MRSKAHVAVQAQREEDVWSVLIVIPFALIKDCYNDAVIDSGKKITFNLYKISEKPCKSETGYVIIQTPPGGNHRNVFFVSFSSAW